jgi:predicted HNH restriction endonuclease
MKWTKENINYLIDKYPSNTPLKEILQYLKRSKKAVSHKAMRLGISRPNVPVNKPKDKNHRKKYDKAYYEKHKKKIYKKKKSRELNYKLEILKKLGNKCNKCGYNKCIAALDFHHNTGEKEKNIAILLRESSKQKILKEVQKCILLCANCHREVHYKNA